MTHTEEIPTTYESKTPAEQMNGHPMTGSESRESEERGSSSSWPSQGRQGDGTSGTSVLEMGSTDSAGSAHGGGPSCGLVSSLFPSSCRGRAEAFARRLHRRLTSLGGEDSSPQRGGDPTKPKETSWLHTPTGNRTITTTSGITNHVLQRQPRHSPETELFYDFDLDLEDDDGPGSPAEEATAAELADLLVNTDLLKNNHHDACHCSPDGSRSLDNNQDPESGCVFASPVTGTSPDSDSSEVYFDPESSDGDKQTNEAFFDPVTTSDSEVNSNLSNGCTMKNKTSPCHRRKGKNLEACEDTSDSSCSLRRANSFEKRCCQENMVCNSEDSSNGKSSLETTSPSHESLWSTFEDSTMSLQDESPSKISCNSVTPQNRFPKSHSDSEIPVKGGRIVVACELSRRYEEEEEELENEDDRIDEVDFLNCLTNVPSVEEEIKNAKNLAVEESADRVKLTCEDKSQNEDRQDVEDIKQDLSKNLLQVRVEDSIISNTDTDHSTYSSTINIPGALTLECSTGERINFEAILKNEVNLQIENGTVLNDRDDDKMCLLLQKLSTSPSIKQDEKSPIQEDQQNSIEEEEEDRPQRIRRCSSLKTGKTPPGTPGRKKIVRFADVLGLDLADVRTFLDEIPKVPNSAYSDLIYDNIFQKDTSPANSTATTTSWNTRYTERRGSGSTVCRKLDRTLVPLFQQPGGQANFLDLVRERCVCLENVLVQDPISLCVRGTVRVINLDFHKSVHIRYTLNSWRNFSDLQATYVPNSCDGFSDKFSFVLYCHTLPVGQRLEFAVRFHCKGQQYWDNNAGANYCFQCLPNNSPTNYIPITAGENQNSDWPSMFY